MFEILYDTRSEDYPFTYIKLFVEEKGIGGTPRARLKESCGRCRWMRNRDVSN
jgi:hypothetical protein